jgi:thiamine-phosphate pyrophosphorylase
MINGLYGVTPDCDDTPQLVRQVAAALSGGARVIQYRNKTAGARRRLEQAAELAQACRRHGALFIVNDHADVAAEVGADGVHLGADDGNVAAARDRIGRHRLIGVSCYNRLELARDAVAAGADYVAFGSFFVSRVKPGAVHAPLTLLGEARAALSVPIVAIGGITPANAQSLIAAGADALAVISALFAAPDVAHAAQQFSALFPTANHVRTE